MGYSNSEADFITALPAGTDGCCPKQRSSMTDCISVIPRRASLAPKLRAFIDMARNHLNKQCPFMLAGPRGLRGLAGEQSLLERLLDRIEHLCFSRWQIAREIPQVASSLRRPSSPSKT